MGQRRQPENNLQRSESWAAQGGRIGAGRNLLFCQEWIDEWLMARGTTEGR